MIKNIIFDLGGVLLDLDRSKVIDAYAGMSFTEADELLNNFRQKGVFKDLEQGSGSRYDVYRHIRESTGMDVPAWRIDDALNNYISGLAPYKLKMLERLRRDYKLFVLSNTNEIMHPEIARIWFTQSGRAMDDYFDRQFLSFEMYSMKPDREIFEKVLSGAGIRAEESLFIDDGDRNIEAARGMGFLTYRPSPGEDLTSALVNTLALPDNYFSGQTR